MGFSKQMCHEWENNGSFYTYRKIYHGFLQTDVKGIMLTLIDSLGHNPC